ncbi:MAG: sensor histidine kinase [Candidatus Aminicenantales bacterium]
MSLYHEKSKNVYLEIKSERVKLDINKAIPCALLINEIITNALKHAFPDSHLGKLTIIFEQKPEGKYYLRVEGNDIGLPLDINTEKPKTLGPQLINDLAFQLGGELKLYRNGGTAFELVF